MSNSMRTVLLFSVAVVTGVTEAFLQESSLEFSDEIPFPTTALSSFEGQRVASAVPETPSSHALDLDMSHLGPENVVMSSSSSSNRLSQIFPTVHSADVYSAQTSSASLNLVQNDDLGGGEGGETISGFSPKEVVIIAICVALLSLVIVSFSIVATFLIRRRMRRKAYLRVKHASQTELALHFVQNTPASVAARDSAMEQLFQSLASMDPEAQTKDCIHMKYEEERCLSPTDSIASADLTDGKGKACSRSLPSLKNLNAHEEALSCTTAYVFQENSGKLKGRSRSFTERAALGVDVTRGKSPLRSNSEKLRNRVFMPTAAAAGKRFEKKSNGKFKRRSAPSFSRLARFGFLRNQSTKRKPTEEVEEEEEVRLPCVARPSDATDAVASDSRQTNDSLLDFELPSMSPILQDIGPMLNALQDRRDPTTLSHLSVDSVTPNNGTQPGNNLTTSQTSMQESNKRQQHNGRSNSRTSLQSGGENGKVRNSDVTIDIDGESETRDPNGQKIPNCEEVWEKNLTRSNQNTANSTTDSARNNFDTSCKDRSVNSHNKVS